MGEMYEQCEQCGTDHDGYPTGSLGAETRCLRARAEASGDPGLTAEAERLRDRLGGRRDAAITRYMGS